MTNKKRQNILAKSAALITAMFSFGIAKSVMAINTGLQTTAKEAGLTTAGATDVYGTISNVISAVLGLVGVIFLILTIYSGFLWMTAQGNPEQVKKAKTMIVQSIIGMVVIFSAYFLTDFVLQAIGI